MISSRRRLTVLRIVNLRGPVPFAGILVLSCLILSCSTGCTSALTTTYLKGMPWDLTEHAAEIGDETTVGPTGDTAEDATRTGADELAADAATEGGLSTEMREADAAAARQAAVEEAVARLATLGTLDAETQATLVATLQRTSQEDWPAVVDEFSTVLAESRPRMAAKPEMAAIPPAPPETEPEPEPAAAAPEPVAEAAPPPPAVAPPGLAIHNACFASRVQAWGILDRFTTPEFRRGQELIVYFELENLTASETAGGHTTCIDTALSLVAADGRRLHAWTFEPIAETCPSRRRDYFARYVLRIPEEATAGDCRVEVAVTDTLAGETATTSLPLSIVAD
jgi:hypothetical protein